VPLRFTTETLGAQINWDPTTYNGKNILVQAQSNAKRGSISNYTRTVNGITARVVEIPPGTAKADVVLGQNSVGGLENLAPMASRSGAVAAINGTFFEAYGGISEP